MNWVRLRWGILYCTFGIFALILSLAGKIPEFCEFLDVYFLNISWCVGWAAIGIAAGLFNSLDDNTPVTVRERHYVTYFLFVLFIASLAAFAAFLSASKNYLAYTSSALVAILTGFVGDRLANIILKGGKI